MKSTPRKLRIKPYLHVIRMSSREDRANSIRLVLACGATIARLILLTAIYKVAYQFLGNPDLPFQNALWCIAIYFALMMNLGLRHLFKTVEEDVVSGNVEVGIIKPLDWRLVKVCQLIGKNGLEFLLQLVILPIVLWLLVGLPNVDFWSPQLLLGFAVLGACAIISGASLYMIIGLSAFWLNDAKSINRLVDKAVLVFGGGFVPIALLPDVVQTGVRYSPFGVYAAPTQLFNPAIASVLTQTIIAALVWSVVLLVLTQVIWQRVGRRIEVNGG